MAQKVKIIADSTADLSPELIEKYDIATIPLLVTMGEASYEDGVSAKPDDLYAFYRSTKMLPKTASPSPERYAAEYEKWSSLGYEIVNFNISSAFSASHANAKIAASAFPEVYPIDSENLSTGIGLQVLEAAELARQGRSAKEIAESINALRAKVRASFIIDNLQFLWKGGRCSGVAALGANLLRLKPCIEVTEGRMEVGKKYRGSLGAALTHYVTDKLAGRQDLRLNRIFVTHSGMTDPGLIDDVVSLVKKLQPFEEVLVTRAGCTVSSHCGPNTLGVLFIVK